jgi:two-component system sensor histidine kinase KdpD
VALLEALGPHLAHAIANVRAQLRADELAMLKERMSLLLVHDLKNPLTIVKVNLDMLDDPESLSPVERAEVVADARAATQRLLGMVVDLLDIGRAEENQLFLERRPTVLAPLIEDVLERFRRSAALRSVDLLRQLAPGLVLDVDPKLLLRVIENILSNALRYTPECGEIRVAATADERQVQLAIENNGPPIPETQRAHLFEKYGQLQGRGARYNRGLGLYLCRLVVELHGGSIAAADRSAGGVRFEIRLPRARDQEGRY